MKNIFFIWIGLLMINIASAQSGNVGIGTTTPTAKLHVNGSVKITDGTQGAGKVLTSDAAGKGTWQTMTTSSSSSDSIGVNALVWIGCNAWMTKNLDVTTYRNGDPIPLVTNAAAWAADTLGAYCYYANTSSNGTIYGKLYNWYAVNNPKGLAPEGWHIPSDFEWTYLVSMLGGNSVAGGPMKSMGTMNWTEPNLGATNVCNFAAEPGGQRNATGTFSNLHNYGNWWSSSPGGATTAWSRNLNFNDTSISGAGTSMKFGYSVRCVRD